MSDLYVSLERISLHIKIKTKYCEHASISENAEERIAGTINSEERSSDTM